VTAHDVFINARIDTYWLGERSGDERSARGRCGVEATLERAKHYVAAGADGIFVPGVKDPREIARLTEALDVPLNVLFLPDTLSVPQLAELGVARISTGSLLYRVAHGAAIDAALGVRDGGRSFTAPPYAAVDALSRS
jgi:2-methylisocitrate lyase-like PEP mutase family enzyme